MNRRITLGISLGALFVARSVAAQEVSIGYQGLPYKYQGDSKNAGIQVSDGVLMHVGAGAEAGYDSNVFYGDSAGVAPVVGSGIIRATSFVEITNATRTGATPSGLFFDARAGLMYRRYTSGDAALEGYQNSFMPSAGLSLNTSAGSAVSFGFADTFVRMEDAPYNPGDPPIKRDNNQASVETRWAPGGGRINLLLRYTNILDYFETQYGYANSLTHDLMLDGSWKWLPKTALFFQLRQGYVSYLNDSPSVVAPVKYNSFPLRAIVGLRGLITEKTSALVAAGYVNSFYSCPDGAPTCVNTGGFGGSLYLNGELTLRPTLLSRFVLGYRRDFQNAVISTFYYGDSLYASYVQQIAGRFALDLSGRYQRRDYQGYVQDPAAMSPPESRVDNFFQVGATADYFLRNWAYIGVGYALLINTSDAQLTTTAGVASLDYTKHQVFARIGVTY